MLLLHHLLASLALLTTVLAVPTNGGYAEQYPTRTSADDVSMTETLELPRYFSSTTTPTITSVTAPTSTIDGTVAFVEYKWYSDVSDVTCKDEENRGRLRVNFNECCLLPTQIESLSLSSLTGQHRPLLGAEGKCLRPNVQQSGFQRRGIVKIFWCN